MATKAMINIQNAIDGLSRFAHLHTDEAKMVMLQIMNGGASEAQIGAYLMALRMKGETIEEITGSARAMRAAASPVPTHVDGDLLDTCGTGGDNSGTFNISTTVAFVASPAGITVAKHGNRAASSKCGSADVLAELGLNLDLSPEQVGKCVDELGIGFLFAVKLHPAMRHAIGPRRELGIRTIFNILGPLTNPAGALRQVIGVFDRDLVEPLARVLGELGSEHVMVVHSEDGLDELSLGAPTHVAELRDGAVRSFVVDAGELGFASAPVESISVDSPAASLDVIRSVLAGDSGPAADITVLNSAAAIYVSGIASNLEDGIRRARESIGSGQAANALERLVAISNA